jgi:hypothetical protein
MAMMIVLAAIIILVTIAQFVIWIMVLIKLFKEKGILHGILGIICNIYPFIWGWMSHKRLKITRLMIAWSLLFLSSIVITPLMNVLLPDDFGKEFAGNEKIEVAQVREKTAVDAPPAKKDPVKVNKVSVSAENQKQADEWSRKAQELWKDGKCTKPRTALTYLDLAVGLNPNDAVLYNNRGLVKKELGQHQQAIEDYSRAIYLNPKYAVAHNNRGVARYALAMYEQAIEDYSQAIRLDAKYVDAYFNQALANYQLDRTDRMCIFFEKACDLGSCDGLKWANEQGFCK